MAAILDTPRKRLLEIKGKQAIAWQLLEDKTTTQVLYGGAAGGGKSFLGCSWHIYRRTTYPESRGLIGREVLKDIKDSTLVTFMDVARNYFGYVPGRDFRLNGQDMVIRWRNGSMTVFRELKDEPSDPDFDKLGSTEYTDAFVDEVGQISKKAFQAVTSRIRYKLGEFGLKSKTLGTCNPGYNWVRSEFVKDKDGMPVQLKPYQRFVRSLLDDNPDVEFQQNYREELEKLSEYQRRRLLLGDWDALPRDGNEYYPDFNPDRHVGLVQYDPQQPIHFCFDKNKWPYYTCLMVQIVEAMVLVKGIFRPGWEIRVIDEFCYEHPFNTAISVCDGIMNERLPYHKHQTGAYVHADYSMLNTEDADGRNDIDHIHMKLLPILSAGWNRLQPNPSVDKRQSMISGILSERVPDVRLKLAQHCKHIFDDFMYMKADPGGGKLKKKVMNPITKKQEEQHGHTSDALEYCVSRQFPHLLQGKRYA